MAPGTTAANRASTALRGGAQQRRHRLTLGYQINDNLNLTVGYKSTVNDNAPGPSHGQFHGHARVRGGTRFSKAHDG